MSFALLKFEDTTFDVVDRSGNPWLRLHQIGVALGYSRADSVNRIYQANADEFTDSMTDLVELDTNGGKQQVRIFSLRGCHLLAMLARTDKAKAFRKWVLDVLEGLSRPADITGELISMMSDVVHTQRQTMLLIERLTSKRKSNSRPPVASEIPTIFALKAQGCSQASIAREMDLSTAAVSLILRGQYRVNHDNSVSVGALFKTENLD